MATRNAKASLNERYVVDTRHSADVAQLVARHLAKVKVAGSTPVIRSLPPIQGRYLVPCATVQAASTGTSKAGCSRELVGTVSGERTHRAPFRTDQRCGTTSSPAAL